jgi:hypothetical protein
VTDAAAFGRADAIASAGAARAGGCARCIILRGISEDGELAAQFHRAAILFKQPMNELQKK